MKIDDSIKFIEFVMEEVFWEGAMKQGEAEKGLAEVLRQLKLRRADITRQEIKDIEKLLNQKREFLKEVE